MDNPAQPIKIQSYTETYQRLEETEINPDGGQLNDVAPFALVSVPVKHYNFAWDVNEEPHRLYGRIMKATQFQRTQFRMISKKRKTSECDSGNHRTTKAARKIRKSNKEATTDYVLNPMSVIQKKSVKNNLTKEMDCFEIVDVRPQSKGDSSHNDNIDNSNVLVEDLEDGDVEIEQPTMIEKIVETEDKSCEKNGTVENCKENIQSEKPSEGSLILPQTNNVLNTPINSTISETEQIVNSSVLHTYVDPVSNTIADSDDNNLSDGLINFSFTSALEEIEQQKQAPKIAFDLSFIQIQDTQTKETVDILDQDRPKTPPPPNISFAALSEHETNEICAEMHRLEKQEEMLNKLKHSILSTQRKNRTPLRLSEGSEDAVGYHVELSEDFDETAAAADNAHDSDSNYSFSDYFAKHQESTNPEKTREIVTLDEAIKMPDFIPLGQDDDEMDMPSTKLMDISENSANTTAVDNNEDNPSKYSEAKIFLTKDHSKYLLTRQGGTFLTETYTKHNVIVRMEWRSIGNVLIVQGKPNAQDNFHADLIAYCTSAEEQMRKKQEISQQVPKNRSTLIRFLKEQIGQLEKPIAYAKEVFVRMKINEQQRSKTGTKNADKARKTLNMILFGQTGMRDGAMHLTALQSNLRCLIENETREVISNVFRNEVFQHYKYIFSSFSHDNYPELIREYEQLRKNKQLPVLKLDRRLLGLKINVNEQIRPISDTVSTDPVAESTTQSNVASSSTANSSIAVATESIATQPLVKLLPAVKVKAETPTKKSTDKVLSILTESVKIVDDLANISEVGDVTVKQRNTPYVRNVDALPSMLWSLKCSAYIEKCRAIPKIKNNEAAMARLQQVDVKAKIGALSYNDFRMLMRIFDKCN